LSPMGAIALAFGGSGLVISTGSRAFSVSLHRSGVRISADGHVS
jgi:hypothetical protein